MVRSMFADVLLPDVDRRTILALLLGVGGVWWAGPLCATAAGAGITRSNDRDNETPASELVPHELATLGARLSRIDPSTAGRLVAYARAEATALGIDLSRAGGIPHLCSALLDGSRVRRDFLHGRVETVDRWVLARSEAAACVIAHRASSAAAACVPDVR